MRYTIPKTRAPTTTRPPITPPIIAGVLLALEDPSVEGRGGDVTLGVVELVVKELDDVDVEVSLLDAPSYAGSIVVVSAVSVQPHCVSGFAPAVTMMLIA